MKLGVFTQWIKATSIEELAQRVRELDLSCVVLDSYPGLDIDFAQLDRADCQRIKAAFASAGVEIAAVGHYCNLGQADPDERESVHRQFRGAIEFSAEIGAPMICSEAGTFHPTSEWEWDPANGDEQAFDYFAQWLRPLITVAEQHGVILGIEPYVMTIIHTPERAARLIETMNSPALRLVADPAGIMTRISLQQQEAFLPTVFQRTGSYIGLVHVEDCRPDPQGHFLWLPAGQGLINYPLFMDLVIQTGYDGPLILEHLSEAALPAARDYVLHHWTQAQQRAEAHR